MIWSYFNNIKNVIKKLFLKLIQYKINNYNNEFMKLNTKWKFGNKKINKSYNFSRSCPKPTIIVGGFTNVAFFGRGGNWEHLSESSS